MCLVWGYLIPLDGIVFLRIVTFCKVFQVLMNTRLKHIIGIAIIYASASSFMLTFLLSFTSLIRNRVGHTAISMLMIFDIFGFTVSFWFLANQLLDYNSQTVEEMGLLLIYLV